MRHDEMMQRFRCDFDAGKVYWRNGQKAGTEAGTVTAEGYRRISVGVPVKYVKTHRVIMTMYLGHDLSKRLHIDHINGDRLDNRIVNLRVCGAKENCENASKPKNNTTGFKGVSRVALSHRYRAYICHNRRQIHLGMYDTAQEAHTAYLKAAQELGWKVVRSA